MSPKIYVASLSDYNAGRLHGTWIDATQGVEAIEEEIQEMLDSAAKENNEVCIHCGGRYVSGHQTSQTQHFAHEFESQWKREEYAIHDYEDFGGIKLEEYTSIETVSKLAQLLEEFGEAFGAWYGSLGADDHTDGVSLADEFQDAYQGEFDSVRHYAEEFVDGIGMFDNVNSTISAYFDYDAFARDLELGGDIWTAPTSTYGVYVFNGNV